MKLRILRPALLILASGAGLAGAPSTGDGFVAALARARPDVRWDRSTWIEAIIRGVPELDSAALGYTKANVVLAVGAASKPDHIQYLTLGIGAQAQDSLCATTAKLSVSPLKCEIDGGEKLPGCVSSPRTAGLVIDDGDCDPFYVYWNHRQKQLVWWRN